MKKNRMMRLASILLVCVLLTTSVISGTFAKYTSTASGTDTARVAQWKINVGTVNIAQAQAQTLSFGLFDTIKDTDGSTTEEHVNSGLIAPGTKGDFSVTITNNSEVDARIVAALSATETANYNIPILYSKTGTSDWVDDLSLLSIDVALDPNETTDVVVYWQWVYEAASPRTNADDTALGIAAAAGTDIEVTVTMTVTATQID